MIPPMCLFLKTEISIFARNMSKKSRYLCLLTMILKILAIDLNGVFDASADGE
jgi:hypothetical protein